jgi:hypothetical protein
VNSPPAGTARESSIVNSGPIRPSGRTAGYICRESVAVAGAAR